MHRLRRTGLLAAFFCGWAAAGGAGLLAQPVEGPKDEAARLRYESFLGSLRTSAGKGNTR